MKGTITIQFSSKEAVALLSNDTLPKSITNKVVTAFRAAQVTPQGAKASALAKAPKKAVKRAAKQEAQTNDEASAH